MELVESKREAKAKANTDDGGRRLKETNPSAQKSGRRGFIPKGERDGGIPAISRLKRI